MNEGKTARMEPTPFVEALAQNRQLDPERMRFPFSATDYESVKDTVPREAAYRVCGVCHFPLGQPGWVRMDWPVGHPLFGQAIPCPRDKGR